MVALMVMLHGSGSSGVELRSYLEIVPLARGSNFLKVCKDSGIEIITPSAQPVPYTPNYGFPVPVWFDRAENFLELGNEDTCEDVEGVERSLTRIFNTIKQVEAEFDEIFIGGFSQGGCLALYALHKLYAADCPTWTNKVRGVFSMGSFLINKSIGIPPLRTSPLPVHIPVYMMHGEVDGMIKHAWGQATASNLLLGGVADVQFTSYEGVDHEISEDELRDLLAWVGEVQIEHKAKDAMKNATAEDELGEEMDAVYSAIGSTSASSGGNGVKGSEDNAGVGYGAGKAKGKAHGLGQGRDSDYSELISAAGGKEKEGGKDRDSRPYTLEEQGEYSGSWVISFPAPKSLIPMLCSRPVLCCGGAFEIRPGPLDVAPPTATASAAGVQQGNGTVCTTVSSSDPDKIALELHRRLIIRAESDGASVNACPMQ